MRVLHVSEALGGGITSALLAMAEATPEIDHHLLASPRAGHDTGDDLTGGFASVRTMSRRPDRAFRQLRAAILDLDPDVVHAHSSFAGLLVRSAPLNGQPVAYSPHGFAFERRDVPLWQRRLYRLAERAMAVRTDLLIAVSPYEADCGQRVGYRHCWYVPNRANLTDPPTARFAEPLRIAAAGRISPPKDWRYFVHVKRYAEAELGVDAEWEWIGGGSEEDEGALRAAGVKVTGWIGREDLLARLSDAQVYLHTASWDAAPITIFEAGALGLPTVIRSIPSLTSLQLPGLCHDVPAMAARIAALQTRTVWEQAQQDSAELRTHFARTAQAWQLREAYRTLAVRAVSRLSARPDAPTPTVLPDRPRLSIARPPAGPRQVRATG